MPHQLLLADHSVTIQRVIKLSFADEDVEVTAVGDGNLAVAAIDGSPPDIVLADIGLPGRTGYDVARHLRDTPRLAHIPVVLLADVFSTIDEGQAQAVGCDRVLSKPFDPQVVISCVRELLARPKKMASPAPSLEAVEQAAIEEAPSGDIDAYFDRLDLTFAGLAAPPFPSTAGPLDPASIEIVEILPSDAESPDAIPDGLPALSYASDRAAFDHPFGTVAHESPAPAWQDGSQAAASPPFGVVDTTTAAPIISDELVDEIATRVLDRLLARLSAATVPDIVTAVAERVIRTEIDKIKSRL